MGNSMLHWLSMKKWQDEKDFVKFAGSGKRGFKDDKGLEAEFNTPTRMSFDGQDNLYITDTGNNAIRKITPDGIVSTFYKQDSVSVKVTP